MIRHRDVCLASSCVGIKSKVTHVTSKVALCWLHVWLAAGLAPLFVSIGHPTLSDTKALAARCNERQRSKNFVRSRVKCAPAHAFVQSQLT